jgi:glucose-1-phosphate adenylyltransferase
MVRQAIYHSFDTTNIVVIILGGGRGRRLYPLTKNRAKSAVSFGGKYRLIDIPLTNCLNSQLDKIFVLTQYNSFSLNKHIWQTYSREVNRKGFIDIITNEPYTATKEAFQEVVDALRNAMHYISYHNPR